MTRSHLFTLFLALSLTACPTDPLPAIDAGSDAGGGTDTGTTDTGGGGTDAPAVVSATCDAPHVVTLAASGVTTVTGNTTGMSNALTRATGCGGSASAPQEVLELTLPGAATETTAIRFTLATGGTSAMFDTLVEVRESCTDAATAACFDDINYPEEVRSGGAFAAAGGSTRYIVVSGYAPAVGGAMTQGAWSMDVEVVPNQHAPELTSATALTIGEDARIGVVGMDDDGDANVIRVTFLDAGGTAVGFDLDGDDMTPPETELFAQLDDVAVGDVAIDGSATFATLAGEAAWANVVTASVVLLDGFGQESNAVTATEATGAYAAVGATCDATNVCRIGIRCVTGTCTIPPAVVTACGAATAVTASGTAPVTTIVTVPTGAGVLSNGDPDCTNSPASGEALALVTLPAGTWDLTARTAGTTTADTDTILFLQSTCGDGSSQLACSDDRDPDADPPDASSEITVSDLAAGDYTLAVEVYGGADAATMVDLTITLREVLATGATCDPTAVMNRCATGTCPTTGTAVCP